MNHFELHLLWINCETLLIKTIFITNIRDSFTYVIRCNELLHTYLLTIHWEQKLDLQEVLNLVHIGLRNMKDGAQY